MDEVCDNCAEEIGFCTCKKCECGSVDDIQDNGLCFMCDKDKKEYEETVRTID